MDCHVFRRLCDDLVPALIGGRIEKIHGCGETLMFTLYKRQKHFLYLRPGRKNPFLFLSTRRAVADPVPSAPVMRLRKYLADRRITDIRVRWTERRLWLGVGPEVRLELDLREGARLLFVNDAHPSNAPGGKTAEFSGLSADEEPSWPDVADVEKLCRTEGRSVYPVLTPALRRTLPFLEKEEQAALLADLETGGGDLFVYDGGTPDRTLLSAWPLPEDLRSGRREECIESPLLAAARVGEIVVLQALVDEARRAAARPHLAAAARLRKLGDKLKNERERLAEMAALQNQALALQAELYRFAAEEKQEQVVLKQGALTLSLNPALTVRENMAALFHKAARGRRGLAMLEERITAVAAELAETERAGQWAADLEEVRPAPGKHAPDRRLPTTPTGAAFLPKGIQAFRSSDGFAVLRGRDAGGNLLLLKMAAPHDLWLHAAGVVGAHVLVRRDHAAQVVPESTMQEAGILAALKSERRGEARAAIMAAQAKYVHPLKGIRTGQVRIDRMEPGYEVSIDPALEERLLA